MSPRELGAQRGTRKPIDRLPVAGLGVGAGADEGSAAGLEPEHPVGTAGSGGPREPPQGVLSPVGLVAADARLDELRQ